MYNPYIIPRTALFSILFTLLFTSCEKSNNGNSSGCYCSENIDSLYREDAQLLLFKEIYENPEHEDRNNPYFDEQKVKEILNAIQAVYNQDSPARDEVFDDNQIHVFPLIGLHSIALRTDTSSQEVKNLIKGLPTGNSELDNIISKYKFKEVRTAFSYPNFNWITIIADDPLNLIPIIEDLKVFPFFSYVEFGGGAIGDGNNITIEKHENYMILDFSIGWGDCPSGCIYRKHWLFSVDKQCSVLFLNSFTD